MRSELSFSESLICTRPASLDDAEFVEAKKKLLR